MKKYLMSPANIIRLRRILLFHFLGRNKLLAPEEVNKIIEGTNWGRVRGYIGFFVLAKGTNQVIRRQSGLTDRNKKKMIPTSD